MRYHWIPWIKTNSTHPVASISGYIDFPLFPVLSKKNFESLLLLQFFTIFSSKSPEMIFRPSLTKSIHRILIFTTVCPVQPLKFSRKAAKQEEKSYQARR